MTDATVAFVGAGPGERDLVTLAAEDALRDATFVVADTDLAELVTELAPQAQVELVAGADVDEARLLVALCTPGARVVRLYRGDPWLRATYPVEQSNVVALGATVEVVGGVSSELGLLAAAGIPLHVRHLAVVATITDADEVGQLPTPRGNHTLVLRTAEPRRAAKDFCDAHPDAAELPAAIVSPGAAEGEPPDVDRASVRELSNREAPADRHLSLLVVGVVTLPDPPLASGGERVGPAKPRRTEVNTAFHAPPLTSGIHVVGLLGGRPVGLEAVNALRSATLVVGGADQLASVADLVDPEARTATLAGGLSALDDVADHDGPVAVLASGDPGFHGIGRALARRFGADRLTVHPAPGRRRRGPSGGHGRRRRWSRGRRP